MSVAPEVKPRRAVLQMPEYHPPLAGRDALRLDFNENTFAPSPKVIERLREVTAEGLTKYPEREPGERIAAKHFGLKPEEVLLTNGVDEAIHLVCCAFLEEGDEGRHVTSEAVERARRVTYRIATATLVGTGPGVTELPTRS